MAEAERQFLTYKYRLLPTRRQHSALREICDAQRHLYNAALQERIDCFRKTGKTRSYMDQCKALAKWRADDPDARALPSNLQRWTIRKLDHAYQAFFRRLKTNKKAGFPRFRSQYRWRSFGFAEFCGVRLKGRRLRFKGLSGSLRVHMHRPLPSECVIKSCVIVRDHKGWHVCFQISVPTAPEKTARSSIGIDVGLNVFAYQSDGAFIPNPRFARSAEKELRRRHRAVARCKMGSRRRKKVKHNLAKLSAKVANTRKTWLHQQSAKLAATHSLIVVEDLSVKNMVRNRYLARSIQDAAWATFVEMLSYKAERAGSTVEKVDPKNTSKKCSGCGELVPKSLAVRTHSCPHCGLVIDRDWNAAKNILAAVAGGGAHNVAGYGERAPENIMGAIS